MTVELSAPWVAVVIFMIGQTGALIWFLSSVNEKLKTIAITLKDGKNTFNRHQVDIDGLNNRLTKVETNCIAVGHLPKKSP